MNKVKIDTNIKYVKSPYTLKIDGGEYDVINDIEEAVECIQKGRVPIARFEWGNSMDPILKNGEYGLIIPIESLDDIEVGDAVLCKVGDYYMTHMVMMISSSNCNGKMFLIGNTWMQFYGWTNEIFGIVKGTNILEMPNEEVEEVN